MSVTGFRHSLRTPVNYRSISSCYDCIVPVLILNPKTFTTVLSKFATAVSFLTSSPTNVPVFCVVFN